jgi:hypothetical protein
MIRALRIPVHIAVATSQSLILITDSTAVLSHYLQGNLRTMGDVILPLAIGVVGGAQAGAVISGKLRSITLTRIFVVLLALISMRLLFQGFVAAIN